MPRVMAKVTGTTESVTLNRPGTPSYRDLELTRGRFSCRLEFGKRAYLMIELRPAAW